MKCEICNDSKTVIVHGLFEKPVELPCNCSCDKNVKVVYTNKITSQIS